MRITEVYQSRQGEGLLTGTESVFVRTGGCNLRCWFCDTPYTSWQRTGELVSVEQLVPRILSYDCRHVVITGGEPMLFPDLVPLCETLASYDRHITIETAGTRYLPVVCHLMSLSPKLANSRPDPNRHPRWAEAHERRRYRPDVLARLTQEYEYQVKFVIDHPDDCAELERYLRDLPHLDRNRILLMPQGTDPLLLARKALWLKPYCVENGFRFCPRRQIEWYGPTRGT
ncbi:7-carboxy-7-deazaguanine synthase QueE [Thermostilla marina]